MNIKKRGKLKKAEVIVLLVSLIFLAGLVFIKADDNMIVEANFVGYGEENIISIEVPDYIDLGNVSKDRPISSEEPNIRINNTGALNIIVTPQLISGSKEVFNYTYFRKYISSSNETLNQFHKIGEYSTNVNKNSHTTFYISLNLTDFKGNLSSNNINLNTTIKFVGMAA